MLFYKNKVNKLFYKNNKSDKNFSAIYFSTKERKDARDDFATHERANSQAD